MSAIARSGPLGSLAFRRYFAGQAFSYVGDGLRTLTVPLLVFHLTGSALSTATSFVCEFAPFALFGLVGGSLADRVDRRRLMIGCDFVRFLIMSAFAVAFAAKVLTVPMLYGGLVAISICASFFMGGQSSSIPYLLGKSQATQATAMLLAAENASYLVTPVIGGALFGLFGPLPALVINAATYACSQLSLVIVPTLGPERPDGPPDVRTIAHDAALGFRFLLRDRGMRAISLASFWLNIFGFGAYAILIPFLTRRFGAGDREIGLFLGVSACGAIAGSLLAGKLAARFPFGKTLVAALAVDALIFLPFIFARNVWTAAFFWGLSNVFATFEIAQIVGWRMRVTPQHLIGRVFGAVRLVVLCGMAPGILAFGFVADHYGPGPAMVAAALGYVAVAAAAALTPAIRNDAR